MRNLLFALVFALPISLGAQHFEIGLLAGFSNYSGELAPFTIKSTFAQTHPTFGGFVRYNINRFAAVNFSVNFANVSGNDALSTYPEDNARNLSFKSNINEFALMGEFNIPGFVPYGLERVFSPYLFGGIAFFKYNPRAQLDGEWYLLQTLGTEGQGMEGRPAPYKLTNYAIPFGVGLKYAITDVLNVGLSLGTRYTFTDYLDDVSTTYVSYSEILAANGETAANLSNRSGSDVATGDLRGNPDNNDWYFIGGVTISYNFMDNGLVGGRGRNRRNSGCPIMP